MNKFVIVFILLNLISVVNVIDCQGEKCPKQNQQSLAMQMSQTAVLVDRQTRRLYWYYLRKADMLYQFNFNTLNRFLFFFVYRNLYGTFLCICSWDKQTKQIKVNTIIRMGSGYPKDYDINSPVKLDPFILQFKLQQGQYMIQLDQVGQFRVNGQITFQDQVQVKNVQEQYKSLNINQKIQIIDQFLRKQYWYFIKYAELINTQQFQTNQRFYLLLTYMDQIMGAFLAICTLDHSQNVFVHTFVRLGDQLQKQQQNDNLVFLQPAILVIT